MPVTNKFNKGAQAASTASPPTESPQSLQRARSKAKPDGLAMRESGMLDDIEQVTIPPNQVEVNYLQWKQSAGIKTVKESEILCRWDD